MDRLQRDMPEFHVSIPLDQHADDFIASIEHTLLNVCNKVNLERINNRQYDAVIH
jgi:hypothetical protein